MTMMLAMEEIKLFETTNQCQNDDITQCLSLKRIKIILKKLNDFTNNKQESNSMQFTQVIKDIFNDDEYNNTHLLDDFHHIKYYHKADEDDEKFEEISWCFKDIHCDIKQCIHITNRSVDRSKLVNQYTAHKTDIHTDIDNDLVNLYMVQLICRIHVYMIHSYDLNRLTSKEMSIISEQINQIESNDDIQIIDDDVLEDKKIEIIMNVVNRKGIDLNILRNDNKYIEDSAAESKENFIDFEAIHGILINEDIYIEESKLKAAFGKYDNDKNKFITDIIDAYSANIDDELALTNKISVNYLPNNDEIRRKMFQYILFQYITKEDLNNMNLINIAIIIIKESYPHIIIDEFVKIAEKSNIDGKMFMKGCPHFMKSTKFAQTFKTINNYQKKDFVKIYIKINKWTSFKSLKTEEKKDPNDENIDNIQIFYDKGNNKETYIYDVGTRYYFWESMKYHKHYIKSNHPNLKEEMLNNKSMHFNIKQWKSLQSECESDSKTQIVKMIKCNGYYQSIYNIKPSSSFSIPHLSAMKLYTDYTSLCNIFCSTLRSENSTKIAEMANWTRLLSEGVQCFGTPLKQSKITKYYRGVKQVFKFEMFAIRFNLPTSTTTDFIKAAEFSTGNGLILELRNYKNTYDVFKFDCSRLSTFGEEKETLFFGGDTVLRISSIWQHVGKWMNYRQYVEAINCILRMIHGLSISKERIVCSNKQQQSMKQLMQHIFYTFNGAKSMVKLPKYIENLLKYHASNCVIKLNFIELINGYSWMRSIFTKNYKDRQILDVLNICKLFCNSEQIIFMMPKDYVLSYSECISLITKDLPLISAMDINMIIDFEWPLQIAVTNKLHIDQYQKELSEIKWIRKYSTNWVSFECVMMDETHSKYNSNTIKSIKSSTLKFDKELFGKHQIYSVEGYCHRIKSFTPQQITDLILVFYSNPIRIVIVNCDHEHQSILYDVFNDEWHDIVTKIKRQSPGFVKITALEDSNHTTINGSNLKKGELSEGDIYDCIGSISFYAQKTYQLPTNAFFTFFAVRNNLS